MAESDAAGAVRPSRLRRIARALAFAVAASAVLLGLLYATRAQFLLPWLGRLAAAELEEHSGLRVEYGALGGNLLGELEMRDLRLTDPSPHAPVPRAEVGWLRVRYDLWGLLRGDLGALEELEASRVRVELRAGGGSGGPADPQPFAFPDALPRVRLRDVALRFDTDAGWLRLASADLDLEPAADGPAADDVHTLRLSAGEAAFGLDDGRTGGATLEAELALDGARVELASLRLDGVERARETWLDLAHVARSELEWGGELALAEGELAHTGALRDGRLQLDLHPRALRVGPVFAFLWPDLELPDAHLDGNLGLEFDTGGSARPVVRWNGRMRELRYAGRDLDQLEGEVVWEDGVLAIARLEASVGEDRLRADGVRLPLGRGLAETLREARGALHLESSDLPELLRGVPDARALTEDAALAERVPAHRLELDVRLAPGELRIERGALSLPDGALELQPGSLRWSGDDLDEAFVDLDLAFDFRDLAGLAQLALAPREWSGSLRGRLDLHGPLNALGGELELAGREVVAAGVALGELSARADVDRERVRVEAFESEGDAGRLAASGTWEFADGLLREVELTLDVPDLTPFAAGRLDSGALELRAHLSGAPADLRGTFDIEAREVSGELVAGRRVQTLTLAGSLAERRVTLERAVLEVDGVRIEAAGAVAHAGYDLPLEIELDALQARRDALDLVLSAPVRIELDRARLALPEVHLVGSAGDLRLRVSSEGDDLELEVRGERLDPMPLLVPFVSPDFELSGVSCDLRVVRSGGALSVAGELDVARLRPAAGVPEVSISARGSVSDGRALLERLAVEAGPGRRLELSGEAPLRLGAFDPLGPGPLRLVGSLDLRQLEELPWERLGLALPLAGDLGLDLEVGGDWSTPSGHIALRGERLALVSPRSRTALFGPARLAGRIEFASARVELLGFEFRAPDQAAIMADASLGAGLRPRSWAAGNDGGLREGALTGSLRLDAADLALAARRVPSVRRLDGQVSGEVALGGSVSAPEIEGVLEVREGELRLTGDVPGLSALSARLEFTHEAVRVVQLEGEIGGGPLQVTGLVEWASGTPTLDLPLTGSEVLLVQQPELRLRSDVELSLGGPLDALTLTGELGLRDGRWSKRIDFYRPGSEVRAPPSTELELFSFEEAPLADLRFDVDIRSRDPFVVANNLVDGELLCELRLGGTGRSPDLVGSLFVGETRVSLPASRLISQGGTIRFERDDPLVPQLDVRFTTRTRGYDVTLRLTGTSVEPEVTLTSSPPLSDEDLLLLVLTGKMPSSPWGDDGSQGAVENVAFFIGKDILQGWFGGDSEGDSLLDRIEYRTGADVSLSGAKTAEFSFRLSGPQTGRGRTVLLRAEQDVYDHDNFGLRFVLRGD
ncbi:MAG TPA: translocation/assembly module TamB domain-containing protein [Planctomycetota bacterium]|nr:translocation/assembly module TamB domain-containing protein [Planctomycetota bacterium]